jgi:hypothetical protein
MKHILVLIAVCFSLESQSQKYSSMIDDTAIINFLVWDLKHDKIYSQQDTNHLHLFCKNLIPWFDSEIIANDSVINTKPKFPDEFKNLFTDLKEKNRTDLSEEDKIFMEKQFFALGNHEALSIDKKIIRLVNCKNSRGRSEKHVIQFISLPIFSKDMSIVAIKRSSRGLKNFLSNSILLYKRISQNDYQLIYWQTVYPDTL